MTDDERDQLAQATAEYIHATLAPRTKQAKTGMEVHYINGQRPPTEVNEIKRRLLDGAPFISWLDERVTAAMRQLHGEPTGDAQLLV